MLGLNSVMSCVSVSERVAELCVAEKEEKEEAFGKFECLKKLSLHCVFFPNVFCYNLIFK